MGRQRRGQERLLRYLEMHLGGGRVTYLCPTEGKIMLSAQTKAREKLGSILKPLFKELMAEMVREDLKSAERDELVKKHGCQTLNRQQYIVL
jgi:hypothetical protein